MRTLSIYAIRSTMAGRCRERARTAQQRRYHRAGESGLCWHGSRASTPWR